MKRLIYFALLFLFLSGGIYVTDDWKSLQPLLLMGSLTLILGVYVLGYKLKYKKDKVLGFFFYLYISSSFLSGMIHRDSELLIGAIVMLYIYLVLSIFLPRISTFQKTKIGVASTLYISHLPLLIIPMVTLPLSTQSYSGIFGNPNSLGAISVAVLTVTLSELLYKVDNVIKGGKIKKITLYFHFVILITSYFLIIASSSRTSFITSIAVSLLFIFIITVKVINRKYIKKSTFLSLYAIFFTLIIIGISSYYFTSAPDLIQANILDKFETKSQDTFDGRSGVWEITLSEGQLFGHGRNYFMNMGIGAHNTFVSILGQYGIISSISFLLFLVVALVKSIKLVFSFIDSPNKYLPLMTIISFIFLSMAEGMLLKTNMLILFYSIGEFHAIKINDSKENF